MTDPLPFTHPLRVADLPARKPTRFELCPTPADSARIAAALGALKVEKLRFKGELRPDGRSDWVLEGHLQARVVQPCVVTLAPVASRIEETVQRRYLADMAEPVEAGEMEIPEDDSAEPLGAVIDPGAVMVEALALALPLYPRADQAELAESVFTEPGTAPLRDAELRPFAGLAGLRDKLSGKTPDEPEQG